MKIVVETKTGSFVFTNCDPGEYEPLLKKLAKGGLQDFATSNRVEMFLCTPTGRTKLHCFMVPFNCIEAVYMVDDDA